MTTYTPHKETSAATRGHSSPSAVLGAEFKPSPVAPESKKLHAQLGDKILAFDEHRILGDGNCGFTSLGTTREEVSGLLLSMVGDEKARIELADEIQGLLRENRESKLHTKETHQLFTQWDIAQTELDEQVRQLNNQLGAEAKTTAAFQRQNLEGLIEKLKNSSHPPHQTALTALRAARLQIFQIGEKIKICCQSREVFERYIQEGLACTEWLGYRSAKLFAKLKNYNLYVFHPSTGRQGWLELAEQQVCAVPKNTFYLLHTDGFTHYNLLSITPTSVPALASNLKKATQPPKNTSPSELNIDFSALRKTADGIEHSETKNIVNVTLDACEKRVKEFNKDAQDLLMKEKLREALTELENVINGGELEVNRAGGDSTSLRRAKASLEPLKKTCAVVKAQMMPSSAPMIKAETDWQTHRLRLEQQLLLGGSPLAKPFSETLQKIADKGRRAHSPPNGIFICYAWPNTESEQEQHLQWIQPFLVGLRNHLHTAGLSSAKLDIKDNPPGGDIYTYMKGAETSDFVLLIGTESLLRKHEWGLSAVCTELVKIRRKRIADHKEDKQRVLPLLISGNYQTSFPAEYELYNTIKDWKGAKTTYYQQLGWLIAALYGTAETAFEGIWKDFLATVTEGEQSVLQEGLTQAAVVGKLQSEKKEQEEKEKIRDVASHDLLKGLIAPGMLTVDDDPEAIALRATYTANASITRLFYPNYPLALDDIYINLSIVKEENQRKNEREVMYPARESKEEKSTPYFPQISNSYEEIYGVKETLTLDKLFEQTVASCSFPLQRQLIIGRAGIGKSTLCRRIAYQWARGELWSGHYTWLFWLPLRNLADITRYSPRKEPYTLTDVLKREYLPQVSHEKADDRVAELSRRKDKVLWLLDGWDEIASLEEKSFSSMRSIVDNLLDSRQWPHVIVTSRPYNLPAIIFDRRLEVMGFTPENISVYIDKFFSSFKAPDPKDKKSDTQDALKQLLIKNPPIQGAARIPINLELICSVWERKGKIHASEEGLTMTALYQQMLEQLLRRYLREQHHNKDKLTSNQVLMHPLCQPVLTFLETLAFRGMREPSIILPNRLITEVYETCCQRYPEVKNLFDWILRTGFIKPTVEGPGDIQNDCYFIHLSFQEFFAARYLVKNLCDPKLSDIATNFIKAYKYNSRYLVVLSFASGLFNLLQETNQERRNFFWSTLLNDPRDLTGVGHVRLIMSCLEEVRCDKGIPQMKKLLKEIKRLNVFVEPLTSICKLYPCGIQHAGIPNKLVTRLLGDHDDGGNTMLDTADEMENLGPAVATPEVIEKLAAALNHEDLGIVHRVVGILANLGPAAATDSVINSLFRIAMDYNLSDIPEDANYTLRSFGQKATSKILDEVLAIAIGTKGKSGKERDYAACILGRLDLSKVASQVLDKLVTALGNKNDEIRISAISCLEELESVANTPKVLKALEASLSDSNQEIKQRAKQILKELTPPIAALYPTSLEISDSLAVKLIDTDSKVRQSATGALAGMGPEAATPAILDSSFIALINGEYGAKKNAAQALIKLGPSSVNLSDFKILINALKTASPHTSSPIVSVLDGLDMTNKIISQHISRETLKILLNHDVTLDATPLKTLIGTYYRDTRYTEWLELFVTRAISRCVPLTLCKQGVLVYEGNSNDILPIYTEHRSFLIEAFSKKAAELGLPCQLYKILLTKESAILSDYNQPPGENIMSASASATSAGMDSKASTGSSAMQLADQGSFRRVDALGAGSAEVKSESLLRGAASSSLTGKKRPREEKDAKDLQQPATKILKTTLVPPPISTAQQISSLGFLPSPPIVTAGSSSSSQQDPDGDITMQPGKEAKSSATVKS